MNDQLRYFNVNGSIGRGAYDEPEFATPRKLLAHLDYLGVDRSLVWQVEARDLNPMLGNRKLLDDLARCGAVERLFPAFTITPSCYYEKGVLDFLRESFDGRKVRALRIFPEISRFPVREIERVLAELAGFEPVLLWDCPTFVPVTDFQGLVEMARTFPQVDFVVTQKMWPGFGSVLDAMWRCDNISVDISWLHMLNTIELLVRDFGAERVLFGLGYKTHYGAAVAMLNHARVTVEDRELIAHGNIERMLGIEPLAGKLCDVPKILDSKPVWQRFRSGKPVDRIEIIDAHTHTGPHTRGWFLPENDREQDAAAMIRQMDGLGIDRMLVASAEALFGDCPRGNEETARFLSAYSDRFSGYLVYNPLYAAELDHRLDEFFADSYFVGFKLLASYWKTELTDEKFVSVWEYADSHHLPILLHTWDDKYNSPAQLTGIAARYRNAKFLLGHAGGGTTGRLEAEALVLANRNVYLEFCGSFTTPRGFETSAGIVGWDRIVFGTDTNAHSAAWELGRYLSMPVPDEVLEPGLAANMKSILSR